MSSTAPSHCAAFNSACSSACSCLTASLGHAVLVCNSSPAHLFGDMQVGNDGFGRERCGLGESLAKNPLQIGLYGGVWALLLVHLAGPALVAGLPDDF